MKGYAPFSPKHTFSLYCFSRLILRLASCIKLTRRVSVFFNVCYLLLLSVTSPPFPHVILPTHSQLTAYMKRVKEEATTYSKKEEEWKKRNK